MSSNTVVSSLFPPKLQIRTRSLSDLSISSSRSTTPVPSIAPSTPHIQNTSPRSSIEIKQPLIIDFVPRIVDHLGARDILNLSATTRRCRDLRTSLAFRRHLTLNGWDIGALVRRAEMTKDSKGRPWMFLARSAVDKGDISTRYGSLPKEGNKQDNKDAARRFFRVLVDIATEHEQNNFETLASIAAEYGKSLIRFVAEIKAHGWKTRYRKTFIIAAFLNSQPPPLDAEKDLEFLADTLSFDDPKPPLSYIATRANFVYAYGCTSDSITVQTSYKPVPCTVYDAPHINTSHGTALSGVRAALDKLFSRTAVRGFYRKAGGAVTSLHMAIEPRGLASRSRLPFADKNLLTITATVTDGEGNKPWQIEGFVDRTKGVGKMKDRTGEIGWDVWVTPWGITGEKVRGEGKHLGYFVLHWC